MDWVNGCQCGWSEERKHNSRSNEQGGDKIIDGMDVSTGRIKKDRDVEFKCRQEEIQELKITRKKVYMKTRRMEA